MPKTLADALEAWRPALSERFDRILHAPRIEEVGRVERVGDGVALVSGLPNARTDELLVMPGTTPALALELGERSIGLPVAGRLQHVAAGDHVHGTGEIVRAPVGDSPLGRVLDPLGQPLDGGGPIAAERYDPVERPAPTIVDRDLVSEPLQTGTLVIDAMFPIGRGQRELIVGDRSTGKTSLAVDTIINQRRSDVLCIYVAIGQKSCCQAGDRGGPRRRHRAPVPHRPGRCTARPAVVGALCRLQHGRVLPRPRPGRARGDRRPDQACRGAPPDRLAAAPAARARGLSRGHLLPPFPAPRACGQALADKEAARSRRCR